MTFKIPHLPLAAIFLLLISKCAIAQSQIVYQNGGLLTSDCQWWLQKETVYEGNVYRTYRNKEGDQLVKPRTPRTPNEEECPSAKNLPNRQALWEIGMGYGYWQANQNVAMVGGNLGFHPPKHSLRSLTIGANVFAGFRSAKDDDLSERTDKPNLSVNGMAIQDFWYIPAGKSLSIFSGGVYYGFQNARSVGGGIDQSGTPFSKDWGYVIKFRQLIDFEGKSYSNAFAQVMISHNGNLQVLGGWQRAWGRKNAPKIIIAK